MTKVIYRATLYDLQSKSSRQVFLDGEAYLSDLSVGGGPVLPPPGGGGDPPVISGGPIDPYPDIGFPVPQPPITPPEGPPDDSGFIKPPPPDGGWAYHQTYGWMYDPPAGSAGPKR